MNRKLEIRSRMAELSRELQTLNTEVKDLEEIERRNASHVTFADYKYKIGMYGSKLYAEDQIKEVTDLDREEARIGTSGLAYTNTETKDGYCCLMMKDKSEYARLALLLSRLEAAAKINANDKEKEKYIKILLGEI